MKCVYSQGSPKDKRTPADWAEGVERENHYKEHQLPRKKRGGERGHTGVQENPTEPRMEDMTRLREELGTDNPQPA